MIAAVIRPSWRRIQSAHRALSALLNALLNALNALNALAGGCRDAAAHPASR